MPPEPRVQRPFSRPPNKPLSPSPRRKSPRSPEARALVLTAFKNALADARKSAEAEQERRSDANRPHRPRVGMRLRLIEGGAPGLHFYTLNLAKPTTSVLKLLHG